MESSLSYKWHPSKSYRKILNVKAELEGRMPANAK